MQNPIAQMLVEKMIEVQTQTFNMVADFEAKVQATENLLCGRAAQAKKKKHRRLKLKEAQQTAEEESMEALSREDKEQMVAAVLREHQILDIPIANPCS